MFEERETDSVEMFMRFAVQELELESVNELMVQFTNNGIMGSTDARTCRKCFTDNWPLISYTPCATGGKYSSAPPVVCHECGAELSTDDMSIQAIALILAEKMRENAQATGDIFKEPETVEEATV